MASLSEAEEALRSTKQKSNFQRLTRLLMRGGTVLLREIFDSIHIPANLPITLSDPSVERQLREARLTIPESNRLNPSPGVYGKSSDFDISLIFKLLRTICNLTPPPTGWDSRPNNFDHSLGADLVRIKYYRNEVYGHSRNLEIPDDQFLDLWGKISEALLRIAANLSPEKQSNWKGAIENFLHEPLTPKEERYAEELELWMEKDSDTRRLLQGLYEEFREFKEEVRSRLTPVTQHQEDLESSEQSPALEEQNTQVSQDRPSLASGPQKEPIMTDQEKQRKTGRLASITYPQVILVSGKEIPRETVYFDPSEKKLIICSGMPKDISDKVIVLDMSKAGMGGFFSLAL